MQINGNTILVKEGTEIKEISYGGNCVTPEVAIDVYRKHHYKGYKTYFLESIYGLNFAQVRNIVNGKTYPWIKQYLTQYKEIEDNELSLEVSEKEKSSWKTHQMLMTLPL